MAEPQRVALTISQPPKIDLVIAAPGAALPVELVAVMVGPKGDKGDPSPTVTLRLITTDPLPIVAGRCTLPYAPLGSVVWDMALVYLDLTPDDFDATGALRADRDYLVDDYLVQTTADGILFTQPAPDDGLHAVVSYVAAVP